MTIKSPPEKTPRKPSRIWRGVKRLLVAGIVLLILLLAFHRPVLRFVIEHGGRWVASRSGFDLDWKVDGTVLSDLSLSDIKVSGPAGSPVQRITLREAEARYDLMLLLREGLSSFLHGVTLHDADVELDLSNSSPAPAPKRREASTSISGYWVDRVDIRNVNLHAKTPQGDLVVRGLTVLLDGEKTGVIQIEELSVPSPAIHLTKVHGKTEWRNHTLILSNLAVTPQDTLDHLKLELDALKDDALPFELNLHTGSAAFDARGRVANLTKNLTLDAACTLRNILERDLSRWVKLPGGISWNAKEIRIEAHGPVAEPRTLFAKITLDASILRAAGVQVDDLALDVSLHDGKLSLDKLNARSDENSINVSASFALPEKWADAAKADGTAKWKIHSPRVESWFMQSAPVEGSLTSEGTAKFDAGRFSAADAKLTVIRLNAAGYVIPSITADVTTDAKSLSVRALEARLNESDVITLAGSLSLDGTKPVHLKCSTRLSDFASLAKMTGAASLEKLQGRVELQGEVKASLDELLDKNLDGLSAKASIRATNIKWAEAAVGPMLLDAECRDGRVILQKLDAQLTEHNRLTAAGDTLLRSPMQFHAAIQGDLAVLGEFNDLLKAFGAPPIENGSASIRWSGSGTRSLLDITGRGEISITDLKLPSVPDPVSLTLGTKHEGGRAEISSLSATTGKWRADAAASITPDEVRLSKLVVSNDGVKLIDGEARVPLALSQEPKPSPPIDPQRDLMLRLQTQPLELSRLFAIIGKPAPVNGVLRGNVDLRGTLHAPQGKISFSLAEARTDAAKGKLDAASVSLDVKIDPHLLELDASVLQKPLQPLTAHFALPLDVPKIIASPGSVMDTLVDGGVHLPDSSLAVVQKFAPDLVDLRGNIGAEIRVKGPLREPQLDGSLHLDVPAVTFRQPDFPQGKNIKARVSFSGRKVTLDELSGLLSGGEIKASGSVDLTNAADPAINFRADAKEALVMRNETVSLRTNAAITCQGTLAKSHISGSVDLVRGRVFKEIEFLPLSLPNQLPPPPPPAKRSVPGAGLPKPFADWTLGVDVRTRDPIRLMGNLLNGGVVVALKADGTLGKPEIAGKVSLDDARLRLPFSRLAISRGNLIFTKERPMEPELDLQADALVNDYEVTLFGTGSALEPKLRFTSSPPLPEGDIATLLATGATAGDLGSSEGAAANRAAFLVITKLYRSLFHKAVTNRYDDEPPKISVDFSALNVGSTQRSVTVTYELNKHLQAKGSMNADGSFRGLFYYLIRFK